MQFSCSSIAILFLVQSISAFVADLDSTNQTKRTLNPCHESCQNGGVCSFQWPFGYFCSCPNGYKGKNCEICENPCTPDSCLNGATCLSKTCGQFECQCSPEFTGPNCSIPLDPCKANTCLNNATNCVVISNSTFTQLGNFTCECDSNFTGDRCQYALDPCKQFSHLCENNSTCETISSGNFTSNGLFRCRCPPGLSGYLCDAFLDPCIYQQTPCFNNGVCKSQVNNTIMSVGMRSVVFVGVSQCECDSEFAGEYCQCPTSICNEQNNPCKSNSTCMVWPTYFGCSFYCACAPNYYGRDCSKRAVY